MEHNNGQSEVAASPMDLCEKLTASSQADSKLMQDKSNCAILQRDLRKIVCRSRIVAGA